MSIIRPKIPRRICVPLLIERPSQGLIWNHAFDGLRSSHLPGFQSNGGSSARNPLRKAPFSFEAPLDLKDGALKRVSVVGIFAFHCERNLEKEGTVGATLKAYQGKEVKFRFNFVNGHNYFDAFEYPKVERIHGDGTTIQTIGQVEYNGRPARVDVLTIDVSQRQAFDRLVFTDLGTPASFVIFDIFAEAQAFVGCPFHEHSGGIPLGELASIIRVGDRVRFNQAVDQLVTSIDKAADLDEAKGQALTFLSVVTAATLELGGSRDMIRVGLNAARALDQLHNKGSIKSEALELVESVALPFIQHKEAPTDKLVDRALGILERNFAKPITDEFVAKELGLSTSHFRFLFKQATGQPFHKYLIAIRLERAYQLLLEGDLRVSQISKAVGFTGINHFSRAFASRFKVSPASVRKMRPVDSKP